MVLREILTPCSHPNPTHHSTHNAFTIAPNHATQPEKQPQDFLPVPNPMPSYWLQQPHPYAQLRSTPHLPLSCDIAIIGSGMSGVLTAYHILHTSHTNFLQTGTRMPRVVLLDARDLCSGATARNGGHSKVKTATLTSLVDAAARTAFQDFVHRTIVELKGLVDAEGLAEMCEFELRRSFDVFCDEDEFERVKRVYDEDAKKGEDWTKRTGVVPQEFVETITGVKGAVGAFSVESASFWPYKLVCGVLEGLVERFGEALNVQMNTVVTSLVSSCSSTAAENDTTQVTNILTTPRGTLTAQKLVLATNAYTASLLPSFSKTIIPYKGMNSHHTPSSLPRTPYLPTHTTPPHLPNTYNIHFAPLSPGHPTGCDYLNPRPDGTIVVGGGSWFYQDKTDDNNHDDKKRYTWLNTVDDSRETGHFPADAYAHWKHYMANTFLAYATPTSTSTSRAHADASSSDRSFEPDIIWTGIQGKTENGMPFVGRVPPPSPLPSKSQSKTNKQQHQHQHQQWILAGYNGGGMSLIPVAAKAVASMVLRDVDFRNVRGEFGLLGGMSTDLEERNEE